MDDSGNLSHAEAREIYETWRRGTAVPNMILPDGSIDELERENFLRSTWMGGWVARGRIPARTSAR